MIGMGRMRFVTQVLFGMCIGLLGTYSSSLRAAAGEIDIVQGRGEFEFTGELSRPGHSLPIAYHVPKNLTPMSSVLFVLPGAGRNAADYRDAWITASEKFSVLILSPMYSEEAYPGFESYNLAGMITDLKRDPTVAEGATYKVTRDPRQWIFGDLDRIFVRVRERLQLSTEIYDVFGHSAGGQLAHRLAMFQPSIRAYRIVAANSGWYTVPTFADKFPYGIEGMLSEQQLRQAFDRRLVLLLGQLDDENETRGDLMRTPQIDVQGLGRLQRGKHFYAAAVKTSQQTKIPLRWILEVVPNAGHDFRLMSEAAAVYLYGGPK